MVDFSTMSLFQNIQGFVFRHQSNLVKAVLEEELDNEESLLNMLQGVWSSDRGVGGSVGKRILAEINLYWEGEGLTRQQGRTLEEAAW